MSNRLANAATALLLFVALPLLTDAAMPDLLQQHDYLNLDVAVAVAVAAVSLNLLVGYAGQLSLGHAGLLVAGGLASATVTTRWGGSMLLGMLFAVVVTAAVAFLLGLPALRLRGLYLAIVTLAFGLAMQASLTRVGWLSGGSAGLAAPRRVWGSTMLTNTAGYLVVCLVLLLLVWVVDVNIRSTRMGRAMLTIRENEAVAQSFGIDVVRYKLLAFVVSGALAGLAGAMWAHAIGSIGSESPVRAEFSLQLITIVMVAGAGHRLAVTVTALAFWMAPFVLEGLVASSTEKLRAWTYVIGAVALMVTLARHPAGLADLANHRRKPAPPRDEDDDEELPPLPRLPIPDRHAGDGARGVPLLEVSDVTVRFGGLYAVDGASFTVPAGSIVGLIGPNGAGKSTLFNAVTGHVRIERGTIRYRGAEIQDQRGDRRARLGIARSFQQVGLAKDMTVRENFLLAQHQLASYGDVEALLMLPRATRDEATFARRTDEALEALGFRAMADMPVRNLSGGQQRIVEIACLLMTAPDLVMLDEPSAGMAPAAAENLATRLRDLRDVVGRTVLLIEHNVPLVLDTCDYVYVLDAGRVIAEGEPREIAADQQVIDAYFGASLAGAPA
ncbi:MAG TPA: branched-chain amino acid ABC transporter ATP-binding protein/permease [Mycobacteriales bacterium]|jgi:branched-chain amino acid transport system ATP-binding protein/branched-chain amino acid transport system permease protein|nr:branched-chain amino acid ABC transporter ATP-binding protein/permease [Mycobacteriales bacterium]